MSDRPIEPLPAGDPLDPYFPPVPPALAPHVAETQAADLDELDELKAAAGPLRHLLRTAGGGGSFVEVPLARVQGTAETTEKAADAWAAERAFRDAFMAATMAESIQLRAEVERLKSEQGVTRSENARLRTAAGQMEEQATSAQARCDTAQERLAQIQYRFEQQTATIAEFQRRTGSATATGLPEVQEGQLHLLGRVERAEKVEAELLRERGEWLRREDRPAHTEVIRPATRELPERRRGPFTLSDECVERIASRTVLLMAEASANPDEQAERIAERVADRLVRRAGPVLGILAGGAVRFASEGAKAAAQGLEAFREPAAGDGLVSLLDEFDRYAQTGADAGDYCNSPFQIKVREVLRQHGIRPA